MQACRFLGLPGAGKTYRAIQIIEKVKDRGFSLMQVGFCTFTRAARREASSRAAETFDVNIKTLEKEGWFRTLHSACMRCLGLPRDKPIVNFDSQWLQNVVGEEPTAVDEEDSECWTNAWEGRSVASIALSLWDVARNRLVSFRDVYDDVLYSTGVRILRDPAEGEAIVEQYENAKRKEERLDFADCILRYAGIRMTLDGPEEVEPQGIIPDVPVWIFDEAQDTSRLLDRAAQRLASRSKWWYLFGDVNQAIYTWAGANGEAFLRWPVEHEEHLTKTWRCSRNVINLGQRLLWQQKQDREIKLLSIEPRCEGGQVVTGYESDLCEYLTDPSVSTLVMARTNFQAAQLQNQLSQTRIPWKNVKNTQRWPPLASTRTCDAFRELEQGGVIDGDAWRRIVKAVPVALLERGTKKFFSKAESAKEADFVTLQSLCEYGGTENLRENIASGGWRQAISPAERVADEAQRKWGDLAKNPQVIVSTIHGTKGMEADNVILCTGIGGPVLRTLRTPEGREEERRVWYVGATRARDRLVLLRGRGKNYEDLYDEV